ncbi:hypothetical protein JAAARDRAFT_177585 [Jaapia argillacea MUCL 33604]|uniref:VanZ-like domain-containing protein n=1 Tax=Jaapia argillacea MUCL 33604 TaxID=933084 RepID=A0A067PRU2_9AGAM|nr:hypothetical protein JAAARDRAFT_177585 [Jaapia argillacea MUCL 33604]
MDLDSSHSSKSPRNARKYIRKTTKAIMRSYPYRIPKYDMPIRFRPWFLIFTCIVMLILALLGFTDIPHALPLNDKLLHFFCLCFATGIFYFIFDVEEDARRIWFWRYSGLIFTGIVCFFFGGIVSEFVQATLPYKEFQFGDVVANLLGSAIGLCIAYYLERYYRHRREIARLYRPLNGSNESLLSLASDDEDRATPLLPTHSTHQPSPSATGKIRLEDVWDEREEVFGIGDDDDDEPDTGRDFESQRSHQAGGGATPTPKIVITSDEL